MKYQNIHTFIMGVAWSLLGLSGLASPALVAAVMLARSGAEVIQEKTSLLEKAMTFLVTLGLMGFIGIVSGGIKQLDGWVLAIAVAAHILADTWLTGKKSLVQSAKLGRLNAKTELLASFVCGSALMAFLSQGVASIAAWLWHPEWIASGPLVWRCTYSGLLGLFALTFLLIRLPSPDDSKK